jgi:ribosome-binding protein aMBF1 (putative translation factor)
MKNEKTNTSSQRGLSKKSTSRSIDPVSRNVKQEWLPYSEKIASRAFAAMEKKKLSQRELADRMNCSPQYVSRLLKGKENLSLETICKLESALDESIIKSAFE